MSRRTIRRTRSAPDLRRVHNPPPLGDIGSDNGFAQRDVRDARSDDQGFLAQAESELSDDDQYRSSGSAESWFDSASVDDGPTTPDPGSATLATVARDFRPVHPAQSVASTEGTGERRNERRGVDQDLLVLVMDVLQQVDGEVARTLRTLEFGATVLDHLDYPDHTLTFDRVADAVTAAVLAEGGPEVRAPRAMELVEMNDDPRQRLVWAARMMTGQLEWQPEGDNDFVAAVQAGDLSQLPPDARMNCWEATILAAHRAGLVDVGTLQQIYAPDADRSLLRNFLGVDRSTPVLAGGRITAPSLDAPPAGSLLFIGEQGEDLYHVVLVIGGTTLDDVTCMSLHSVGTGGVFGLRSLWDYAGCDAVRVCTDPFGL